jgi:hypothetical protein
MEQYERHRKLCEYLHNDLYIPKNKAYGDSFRETVKKYGPIAALVRMADKWNRIENIIMGGENRVADERLEDTLLDLANYCIMLVMELQTGEDIPKSPHIEVESLWDEKNIDQILGTFKETTKK